MSTKQEERSNREVIDFTEEIKQFLHAIRKSWIMVLLFMVLGAGINVARTRYRYVPMYRAAQTYTINLSASSGALSSRAESFYNNSTAEQMATTFTYILTSDLMQKQVREELGDKRMAQTVNASVAEGTNLLTIYTTDPDPEVAYDTLMAVVRVYPELSSQIVGKTYSTLMDETGLPTEPYNTYSYRNYIIKGALYGLVLAAGIILIRILTNRTILREQDLKRKVNIRNLGVFPYVIHSKRQNRSKESLLMTNKRYEKELSEPLRQIRNKVLYQADRHHVKSIMITSALAGEGKSTITANLAISIAQSGKSVVLIDCDLRNPSEREVFSLKEGEGLREVLEGKIELVDCLITRQDLGLPEDVQLSVVPGGKAMEDGTMLLGSEKMRDIIRDMERMADYVILDSAPAGLLTDAVVLARYVDASIFIIQKDYATKDYILDSLDNLSQSHIRILGGILNGA